MKRSFLALTAVGLLALGAFPVAVANPYYIHLVETIMIYAIVLFGLDIVVGYTGQVSLGHAGLFGVGAYATGVLFMQLGAPVWVTLPASIAVTAAAGALLALPALRVSGPYLAMVTLAFGTIVQILINEMDFLTAGPLGIKLDKPTLFGHMLDEREFYWMVAVAMVATMLVAHRLLRSHIGRAFEALRGSPVAADCMGVSVYLYKVFAFVLSAGMTGLAGGLYAYSEEYISPNTYNFELTVLFLLAIIMGGRKSRVGAILGAAIIVLLPKLLDDIVLFREVSTAIAVLIVAGSVWMLAKGRSTPQRVAIPAIGSAALAVVSFTLHDLTDWRLTVFGVITLFVVYFLQDGIIGFVTNALGMHGDARQEAEGSRALSADYKALQHPEGDGQELLTADGIVMQFGGLKALNNVDLHIRRGTIHGLIGPNGSGKSTMMNVLTGIYTPTAGNIRFNANNVVGRSPSDIALSGIARTFQNVQLFGEMTALQNIQVALHHSHATHMLDVALHTPRYAREHKASLGRGHALLEFVGLDALAGEQARNLPYGKQRLLEIARALALSPQLLLLDEPAAGLTAPDIKELIEIIRKIRDCGITVILIEHHLDVVMSLCDTVTVLDFGQKIAEGTPAQVQEDPKVILAYLGGEAAQAAAA